MMAFFSIIIVLLVKSLGKQLDGLVCVDVFEEGDVHNPVPCLGLVVAAGHGDVLMVDALMVVGQ